MKQVKLLKAVLAVVFSSASAFMPHGKLSQFTYTYISGSVTNPTSYGMVDFHCQGGNHFKQVFVTEDGNDQPDPVALYDLYIVSNHFLASGVFGGYGKVCFCD